MLPVNTHHSASPLPSGQAGNVFAIVLLGVVLFAALVFTMTRGFETGSARLSATKAKTAATDIISYSQIVARAVDRLIQNGVSESDISFENSTVTGYAHTPAVADTAKVFHSLGGNVNWRSPSPGSAAASTNTWGFTGDVIIDGQGDNAQAELLMFLVVSAEMCEEINKQLGVSIDLTTDHGYIALSKFTGDYSAGYTTSLGSSTHAQGCFHGVYDDGAQTGSYTFFKTLIVR